MNPDSQKLVTNLLLTGALGGTGVGLLRNVIKHQKLLSEQAAMYEKIQPPEEAMAEAHTKVAGPIAQGLGVSGAIATALLANAGVDKVYQSFRRKELEKMLGDSEEAYAERLLAEAESKKPQLTKKAGELSGLIKEARTPELSDALQWLLYGSVPLAALGTGVFAHRMLDKTFSPTPGVGTAQIRTDNLPAIVKKRQLEEEETKEASWLSEDDEAFCHALGTVCALQKAAAVRDFVKAVAFGRGAELEDATRQYGFETALTMTKGAGAHQIDGQRFALGLVRAVKTAAWRPQLMLLTAAEILEHAPGQVKLAGMLDEAIQDSLLGATILRAKFARLNTFDAMTGTPEDLTPGLDKMAAVDEFCKTAAGAALFPRRSDIPVYDAGSEAPSEDSHPQDQTEKPDALAQPPTDIIDMALAGDKHNTQARPASQPAQSHVMG
jgi:hypothetical protein